MSHLAKINPWLNRIGNYTVVGSMAVGEEYDYVRNQERATEQHFLVPVSSKWANPGMRFYSLKSEWEAATVFVSTAKESAMHPAYQQIIGMGPLALPLILAELRKKPAHWFWALSAITGENPVPLKDRGRLEKMTEAWITWGSRQGYIV